MNPCIIILLLLVAHEFLSVNGMYVDVIKTCSSTSRRCRRRRRRERCCVQRQNNKVLVQSTQMYDSNKNKHFCPSYDCKNIVELLHITPTMCASNITQYEDLFFNENQRTSLLHIYEKYCATKRPISLFAMVCALILYSILFMCMHLTMRCFHFRLI